MFLDINTIQQINNIKKMNNTNQKTELTNLFTKLEIEVSKKQYREPASVEMINNGDPNYDRRYKKIALPTNIHQSAIEYLTSYVHESEHARQHLSEEVNLIKKFMYKISDVLYVKPPKNKNEPIPLEYYYNYKEAEAKLIECKFLVELYQELKHKDELSPDLIKDLSKQVNASYNDICNITHQTMREIIKSNNIRTKKYPELLTDEGFDCQKSRLFLKIIAPLILYTITTEN